MTHCVLCAEFTNENRAVYVDEQTAVIVNHEPLMAGHLMVLPRRHLQNAEDLTPKEALAVMEQVEKTANLLTKIFGEDCFMVWNKGRHSSQAHLHIHVMPMPVHFRDMAGPALNTHPKKKVSEEQMAAICKKLQPLWEKELTSSPKA